jgi:very-short-patch-repair endonuclease
MIHWEAIRSAYEANLPEIMQVRAQGLRRQSDPYILDWVPIMTPIEVDAWGDIRRHGLPLYPQFPVGRRFIDFADPYLQIGVELDGAAYHNEQDDTARDLDLWRNGWRIFRITGRKARAVPPNPFEREYELKLNREWGRALCEWASLGSEGVFWALKRFYYSEHDDGEEIACAELILEQHRYIDFPLNLNGEQD